jgi:hypothetical protein
MHRLAVGALALVALAVAVAAEPTADEPACKPNPAGILPVNVGTRDVKVTPVAPPTASSLGVAGSPFEAFL